MLSESQMVNIHNASLDNLFAMTVQYGVSFDRELAEAARNELSHRFLELETLIRTDNL